MPFEQHRKRLTDRLQELQDRLGRIDHDLAQPHSKDWEDMAIEREGEEVLESLGTSGQSEMTRITLALQRMEQGAYGICQRCGDPISEERLDAVPEAALCRDCAKTSSATGA